jgi:hypothetical protein
MRALAILSLALWVVAQSAWAEPKQPRIIVDIHASRADIRNTLLTRTPAGSRIGRVINFISNQLEVTGSIVDMTTESAKTSPPSNGTKTIRVYLGQYYKRLGTLFLTAPMVVHEDVNAQWLFDRDDRLIDIVVEKQARVY